MTGWIKMRGSLLDHPKVITIARLLQSNIDFREWVTPGGSGFMNGQIVSDAALRCVTTALLLKVWSVAREHGKFIENDLVLCHSTIDDLDQIAGVSGFGDAMVSVGWAHFNDSLILPNFTEFNVPMTNAEKQKEYRDRKKEQQNIVTETLLKCSNEKPKNVTPREEKRREDTKPSSATSVAALDEKQIYSKAFIAFWELYPNRVNKGAAFKAFQKIRAAEYQAIRAGLERKKKSPAWLKDNGKYIPHAATWLNARGWEDDDAQPEAAAIPTYRVKTQAELDAEKDQRRAEMEERKRKILAMPVEPNPWEVGHV